VWAGCVRSGRRCPPPRHNGPVTAAAETWPLIVDQMSLAEYLNLPGDLRAEIVDGVLRPMTREDRRNREIQIMLLLTLRSQCPPRYLVFHEEVVVLSEVPLLSRIPDVAVIHRSPEDRGRSNHTAAADVLLAVEVMSGSTRSADLREKPVEYALAGIPAFWRIGLDPDLVVVTHRLVADEYRVADRFGRGDVVVDAMLPWAAVPVDDLPGTYA